MSVRVVVVETEPLAGGYRGELVAALLERDLMVSFARAWPVVDEGRAQVALSDAEAVPADVPSLWCRSLRGRSVRQVVAEVDGLIASHGLGLTPWRPWFPVIDFDKCTHCMQCLTFCLFDVYGVSGDRKIEVQNANHCKAGCPACSRVCPEAAIMFPKYGKAPINGAEVRPEDLDREAMKVDISALLGGDVYGVLRERRAQARTRFSAERDESKALLERKRCLAKLGRDLDIPPEVLMTLPSAGDIHERADRARKKEAERRARSRTLADQRPPATEDDWGV